MVEQPFNHTAVLSPFVPLVTLCDRERRMILNRVSIWPGEPRPHAWGSTLFPPTLLFPFLSSLWIRNTPPSTTESDHFAPVRPDKNKPTATKGVRDRSTHWSNQVLKLTDYHISRYVASTFKCLTKWATHRDLIQFRLHQRGNTTTQPCPLSLYFSRNLKSVNSYSSREAGNPSTSTVPN